MKDSDVLKFLSKKFDGAKFALSTVHVAPGNEAHKCHYPGPSRIIPHRDIIKVKP